MNLMDALNQFRTNNPLGFYTTLVIVLLALAQLAATIVIAARRWQRSPFGWIGNLRTWLCTIPIYISAAVVGVAVGNYMIGQGGFKLGVDLSGGTILVYEVDPDNLAKMTPQARQDLLDHPEQLAASLKRRIDPADLYNVTIRPLPGDPPRVEIILPTGGRQQTDAAEKAWQAVLDKVRTEYRLRPSFGNDIPEGEYDTLISRVADARPVYRPDAKENGKDVGGKPIPQDVITNFINGLQTSNARSTFTGEQIENIKNLIQQQGRLEFRILANDQDDKAAIGAAQDWIRDHQAELNTLNVEGKPPPPPTVDGKEGGDREFQASPNGENGKYQYSWVEVGKEELYSMQLNSAADSTRAVDPDRERVRKEIWDQVHQAEAKGQAFTDDHNGQILLYRRKIEGTGPQRITPRDREMGKEYEVFVLTRETPHGQEVTGDYLTSVSEGTSQDGKRAAHFTFNSEGSQRFLDLTTLNRPTGVNPNVPNSGFYRLLAIVLDNQVRSAPRLNQPISASGQISGDFSQKELDDLVRILRAGALPATLRSAPVSENTMGATLGEDTISKGALSVGLAFAAVLIFMLVYYRFAGFVACIALLANLLLTVAFMVLVQATFTLPGLAGLVLMLGMAVDANVLIYERLREERERGASLALAIRNGYDRAFPTIIDTHLTSIFTAIVLYVVGNDQLKGFGISLTVGLIISLFTSLIVTRTIFDIWLSRSWIKKLTFLHIFPKRPNWDFMRIRHIMFALTVGLTIGGAGLFIWHLFNGGLNIDFVGGTAYAGQLVKPVNLTELRDRLQPKLTAEAMKDPELTGVAADLPDYSIEQVFVPGLSAGDKSALFTVRTSLQNKDLVEKIVNYKLGPKWGAVVDKADPGDLLKRIKMNPPEVERVSDQAQTAVLSFVKSTDALASDQVKPALEKAFGNSNFKLDDTPRDAQAITPDYSALTVAAAGAYLAPVGGPVLAPSSNVPVWPAVWLIHRASGAPALAPPSTVPVWEMHLDLSGKPLKVEDLGAALDKARDELLVRQGIEMLPNSPVEVKDGMATAATLQFPRPQPDYASPAQLTQLLTTALDKIDVKKFQVAPAPGAVGREGRFSRMVLTVGEPSASVYQDGADVGAFQTALTQVQTEFSSMPQPERLENFDSQLALDTQQKALYAILWSWVVILVYLWFRFGSWTFGAATVLCLIHDLFFTLGAIALCHYIYVWTPGLAYFLGVEDFKIDLPSVAALLTLVGYSVSDTIVVFDRIREVRGKNPLLTYTMINDSVNQTLSRTILSSLTVFLVVGVLYIFGGEGVHLFAFVMVVGVVVGTYSSIYIASPLLIMFGEGAPRTERAKAAAAAAQAAAAPA